MCFLFLLLFCMIKIKCFFFTFIYIFIWMQVWRLEKEDTPHSFSILLIVSELFAVPVLVLWVGLPQKKKYLNRLIIKLGCEKYFFGSSILSEHLAYWALLGMCGVRRKLCLTTTQSNSKGLQSIRTRVLEPCVRERESMSTGTSGRIEGCVLMGT